MKNRIEDILCILYDYEYIDIDKFYNDKYNLYLLNSLEGDNLELHNELYAALDNFIKFETNYNSEIGDF